MTKASDNAFPSLLITEGTEPSAPAAGKQRLYIDSTSHHLSATNSSGTERDLESAGGGMATDALWDAAGDLAQGTGANTGAKLSAGTAGYFLKSGGAATANAWASRELDYVQKTSNSTITATTAGGADTLVTGASVAYDGATIVVLEFYTPFISADGVLGRDLIVGIFESTTEVGRLCYVTSPGVVDYKPLHAAYRFTPSNASHTYIIKAWVSAGSGIVGGGAGAGGVNVPMHMRITRAL